MKRPILIFIIFYIFGILVSEFILINYRLIILLLIILFLSYNIIGKKAISLLLFFIIGFLTTLLSYPNIEMSDLDNNLIEIYNVKSLESGFNYDGFSKVNNKRINFRFFSNNEYEIGDIIKVNSSIRDISGENNFGVFNKKRYLKSKKLFYSLKPDFEIKVGKSKKLKYFIKNNINEMLKNNLDNTSYNFINSMVLNIDSNEDLFDDFKDLGLSHVLAISGLHINLFIFILDLFGKKLGLNKKKYVVFIIFVLIMYGYIIDFPISLIRALIMYIMLNISIYTLNVKDDINNIYLSSFVCLVINPFNIYSVGFYLSHIAIFSIVYINKKIKNILYFIPDVLLLPLSLQIGMLSFSLFFFGKINLLTIVLNIFIIPIISFILVLAILYIILRLTFISYIIDTLFVSISLILKSIRQIDSLFYIEIYDFDITKLILYYLILFSIFNYRMIYYYLRKNKKYYISLIPVVYILIKPLLIPYTYVSFIDVGQGDSILVKNKYVDILVDTGGSFFNKEYKAKKLYEYLRKNGVKKIDYLFITHDDIDHSGSLDYLVENIKINNIISNDPDLRYKADNVKNNSLLNIDNLSLKVIIDGLNEENSNDRSLVLLFNVYNKNFLLTGDVEKNEENIKINDKIDFLKVSHHGSKHSTKEEFINNNDIENAIISVGKNNIYKHPNQEVLERLKRNNINIYRTDIDGNILVKVNRFGYVIKSYNQRYDILDLIIDVVFY